MKILFIVIILLLGVLLVSMSKGLNDEWPVPTKYIEMKNPSVNKTDIKNVGEALWIKNCKPCHGATGLGDGSIANTIDTELPDLTSPVFKSQTDGSIYYKLITGRDEMPSFERRITTESDRWFLVNYLRTFKK